LKNFLWGNVGKYQIFFVTLQRNLKKDHNSYALKRKKSKQSKPI
jgi:hypothetical protein